MAVGIDLTEAEFDSENARVTAEIKAAPDFNDNLFTEYATKSCPTDKGYWMQLVAGYEKYFANSQCPFIEYVPKQEEIIYEL